MVNSRHYQTEEERAVRAAAVATFRELAAVYRTLGQYVLAEAAEQLAKELEP